MHDPITAVPRPAGPPADQKSRVRSFFDDSKPWQGELYGAQNDYFARVIQRRKQYAFEMLARIPDLRRGGALDIGCGSGVYLEELRSMGFAVSGVDVSAEMLATCRRRLEAGAGAPADLRLADVEHLPFEDEQFDLVVCVGVLGYLLTDERALEEIRRVVKPGGYLLLNLTNMYSLSDADHVLRRKLRTFLRPGAPDPLGEASPPYALQSAWMQTHRGYFFKSYDLPRYMELMREGRWIRTDAMTYGFEFRLLRRLGIVPASWLDRAELLMERLGRGRRIPVLSNGGWVFTGLFRKPSVSTPVPSP